MPMPLSPTLLIASAMSLVDDLQAPRTPRSLVDRFLQGVGLVEDTRDAASPDGEDDHGRIHMLCPADWSTAFVHHAGYWSHFDPRGQYSAWPLPAARTADELAAFAAEHRVLAEDEPRMGDVYLLWSPARTGFVRAGIVVHCSAPRVSCAGVTYFDCLTIDGDTTHDGAPRGACTLLVRRRLTMAAGDRLVRWMELDWTSLDWTTTACSAAAAAECTDDVNMERAA